MYHCITLSHVSRFATCFAHGWECTRLQQLAVLCDDYFESCLMVISVELELSKDVAGATFMAAGGSAPELFTSLLTAMTTQSSAGVGTILGSAVFNLVVIISLSSLVSDGDLLIDYRPVIRDSVCYSISIITMAVCALTPISSDLPELDGKSGFSFLEAVFMTLLYVCYILVMWKNDKVVAMIGAPPPGFEPEEPEEEDPEAETADNPIAAGKGKASAMKDKMTGGKSDDAAEGGDAEAGADPAEEKSEEEVKEEEGGVFAMIGMPFSLLFGFTIPPCDDEAWEVGKEGGAKYYWGAFIMCIWWIGCLTLAMVAWADRLGCLLGVNSFIMGLVVLAAGTSVPDALASMAVARDGEGGMAVSNAIGSNVFDILLGLGIPFIAYCIIWNTAGYATGDEVEVLVACVQLQLILFIVLIVLWSAKWQLSNQLGGALMSLYFFYVFFNIVRPPLLPFYDVFETNQVKYA